ncbi:putative tyrosyl-DNA phosphodiesterase [Neofusicoccum parvum]|nr:putative tyrosyl-DNA phosphodiesterase [Neofusicoccum parvum]
MRSRFANNIVDDIESSTDEDDLDAPARKRLKHGQDRNDPSDVIRATEAEGAGGHVSAEWSGQLRSLRRDVSPPVVRRAGHEVWGSEGEAEDGGDAKRLAGTVAPEMPAVEEQKREPLKKMGEAASSSAATTTLDAERQSRKTTFVPSPIQLTRIRDLPGTANVDAVSLRDILCDPLIVECWQFNYLFDVDFLMGALDEDVRGSVRVKVVHGSWRREDAQKIRMDQWAQRYPNLDVIQAYMPEAFGTHHSKMMVLIRADDSAQVVIHTANMIPKDWTNMTNGIWRSPLLPFLSVSALETAAKSLPGEYSGEKGSTKYPIGSGERFKVDLLRYLGAYGKRLHTLIEQLVLYDFSAIRAALVASTPDRVKLDAKPSASSGFKPASKLQQVQPSQPNVHNTTPPPLRIIFPTVADVRTSVDGYYAGASIHLKTQSATQQKQLTYLLPKLCRWNSSTTSRAALRGPAAPHIKTYIRFSHPEAPGPDAAPGPRAEATRIDWAMLTSANLSTQAWGALPAAAKDRDGAGRAKRKTTAAADESGMEVRICSWEIGVVVWPALWAGLDRGERRGRPSMVPVFGEDRPGMREVARLGGEVDGAVGASGGERVVVGWRMPYDLPLTPYGKGDEAWCATARYREPDVKGLAWDRS